jgi:hypothetical protein
VRLLTFHVSYACRHSGACCNAGWIEPLQDGRSESPLGVSLTLSAFCPTAAGLLFEQGSFGVTTVNVGRHYEGLDARDVMPPLLRANMLMDWEGVARWEELAVGILSDLRDDVERAVAIIEHASAETCERWTPAAGAIAGSLSDAFARARRRQSGARPTASRQVASEPFARFLASHAFACWPMYAGQGIAGAIDHLQTVRATLHEESARLASDARRALDAVLLKEAFRQTDLRLRHAV